LLSFCDRYKTLGSNIFTLQKGFVRFATMHHDYQRKSILPLGQTTAHKLKQQIWSLNEKIYKWHEQNLVSNSECSLQFASMLRFLLYLNFVFYIFVNKRKNIKHFHLNHKYVQEFILF